MLNVEGNGLLAELRLMFDPVVNAVDQEALREDTGGADTGCLVVVDEPDILFVRHQRAAG